MLRALLRRTEQLMVMKLYKKLLSVIEDAVRAKSIHPVPAAAKAAGMAGEQMHTGFNGRCEYSL
jgi:hypothetical protein